MVCQFALQGHSIACSEQLRLHHCQILRHGHSHAAYRIIQICNAVHGQCTVAMDRHSIEQLGYRLLHELTAPVPAVAVSILQSQLFRPILHITSVGSIYMYRHHGISGDVDELNGLRFIIQYRQDHAVCLTCLTGCLLLRNAVSAVDSQAENVHEVIFILVSLAVVTDLTFLQFIGFFRFLCFGGFGIFLICRFLHRLCSIDTVALCMMKQACTSGGSPYIDEDHCDHCKQCQQYSQRT